MTLLSIEQLLAAYREGAVTPAQFLSEKLKLAQSDQYNAWISLISEQQLAQYIKGLEGFNVDELPLYGVPFAIKDNIDLEGLNTTAGCVEYTYQPEQSAFVVELLISAGAIPLGKTNLDQFATGLVGTRSPWGAVKNSFNPEFISGGSSSGSAVAVATNQVFFSLGTDTAGSGRVPAGFNNILGLKPTKGTLSNSGLVPACRTLDCITFFARTADDLEILQKVATVYDADDCYSRAYTSSRASVDGISGLKIGVPKAEQLEFFGNEEYQAQFKRCVNRWQQLGAELVEFDLAPFLEAATLLYQGPWVAERYAATQDFFDADSSACLPVIETIIGGAKSLSAADTFKAMYKLQQYKVVCDNLLSQVDAVLTPTTGSTYTIDEVNVDPIALNSNLGYYTNFMNLLDYSAIAIPASFCTSGLPFGFTLFAPAFSDQFLISVANRWQKAVPLPLGATGETIDKQSMMDIVVCGAHMQGLPLNHQLIELGGFLKAKTRTSENYRFYALAGGPPYRPGLVRDTDKGRAIEVEVWQVPTQGVGRLLAQIPHPLGLGSVELEEGSWVKGFICEPIATVGAEEITHLKSWRNYNV